MRDDFSFREDGILSKFEEATKDVAKGLSPTLDEKLSLESAVNDSARNLEGSGEVSSNENTRGKVRVRTNPNVPNGAFSSYEEPSAERVYSGVSAPMDDSGFTNKWFGQSGSTQTLILIFTAILVVMVMAISFAVIRYLGM